MPCPITDEVKIQLYGDGEMQKQLCILLEGHGFNVQTLTDKPYETKKGRTGQYRSIKITRNGKHCI